MLRIIVISLFVANLLLWAFQDSQPTAKKKPQARPAVVEDSSIPTIHLFSELMQNQDLMSGNRHCFAIGPFHSSEDRDQVRSQLQQVSTEIDERETQALVEKGYWVYLPPYATLLKANEVLLSLQALGLNDVGVIYDGEWQKAISAGYFLRQANALRRKKALEERGFNPSIRVQRESEPRYWLDYEQTPGSDLLTLDMQNRPNDFMQRSVPCPERVPLEETVVVEKLPAKAEQAQAETQIAEEESQQTPEENTDAAPPVGKTETELESPLETGPEIPPETPEVNTQPRSVEVPAEISEPAASGGDDVQTETTTEQAAPSTQDAASQALDTAAISAEEKIEKVVEDSLDDAATAAAGPVEETEPQKSVGTGPLHSFGSESEPGNETEPQSDLATEAQDDAETESGGG